MTALPTVVRVGYRDYAIIEWDRKDAASSDRYGECDKANAIIRVSTDYGALKAANTLLHEVLHACFDVAAIEGDDPEERTVTSLANVLAQVIRDNPDLVAYLTAALAPSAAA